MSTRPSLFKSGLQAPGSGGIIFFVGKRNPVPPPPVGAGVGAGPGGITGGGAAEETTTGKFKNPPRRINEVLVETPVPGWPRLLRTLKPAEVAWPPPTSITPLSIKKLVELAESARATGGNKTESKMKKTKGRLIHYYFLGCVAKKLLIAWTTWESFFKFSQNIILSLGTYIVSCGP